MRVDALPTAAVAHPAGYSTRRASSVFKRDDIFALIRDCDALLQIEPTCLHARAVRGHAYMKAKMWDRAVIDFTAILDARPDDIHARFSRGMALFKSERVDDANADFSCVLELNPHHVMARYARAGCYNSEGKFHHAIEEYTIALQHDEMENDLMQGIRAGKLGRWRHQDGEPTTLTKVDEDSALQIQRLHERDETLNAAGWSPPKRSGETSSRRESAPVFVQVSDTVAATQPISTTVGKRPRKVVQVKLNLSEFTATPVAPSDHPTTANPPTKSSFAYDALRGAGVTVPPLSPPPAPPELGGPAVSVSTQLPVSTPTLCHSTPAPNGSSGKGVVLTNDSVVAEAQGPRRAVRRVTIAL